MTQEQREAVERLILHGDQYAKRLLGFPVLIRGVQSDIATAKAMLDQPQGRPFTCFSCRDGNTPLYCLNCAKDLLNISL